MRLKEGSDPSRPLHAATAGGSPLARLLSHLFPGDRLYWVLVPMTGVISGLMAVGLEHLLWRVHELFWGAAHLPGEAITRSARESPWRVIGILALGGVAVTAVRNLFGRRYQLQGTPAIIEALAFKRGRLPVVRTLALGVLSTVAIGMGATLGREGGMIQAGSALGSWFGVKMRLKDHQVRILLACGAAGGIAAAYNVPFGASVFAMEVLLGTLALELFGPIIVASVIATTIYRATMGDAPAFVIAPDKMAYYKLVSEWELLLHPLLGGAVGLISVAFIRIFSGLDVLFRWLQPVDRIKPLIAMLVLAIVGIFYPQLFGNGYGTINSVLAGEPQPLRLLIILPVLKILATALCRAGGVPGGLFTPSLFIGALAGVGFGLAVNDFFPAGTTASAGTYALVGMGAILAGTMQAPITAILIIFEMTQDYAIILPIMTACIASAAVSRLLQAGSLNTEPLRRRGIRLPRASAPAWIMQPSVQSVLQSNVATVSPAARFEQVTEEFLKAPEGQDELYVTGRDGEYLGMISIHDIKRFFRETNNLDSVIAADLLNSSAPRLYVTDPVSRAIEILSATDAERLPVLDGPETRKLMGTVSKRALLQVYRETSLARDPAEELPKEQD